MSIFYRGEQRSMGWWAVGDNGPSSGRTVTPEQATYLAPVFGAIRHIVDFGATLPADAYRENADGTRAKIGLPQILRRQNDPGMAGMHQWISQGLYGMATAGNAVGWILDWDGYGNPTDVRWMRRVDWAFNEQTKQWYAYGHPVPASRVFHVPWIVPEGYTLGLSPIGHAMSIVRAGLSAQEYADIKRGGGLPPSVLKNNRLTISPKKSRRIASIASQSFASGEPFVTGADWDLNVIQIPPNHTQFIETMKMTANNVATIYGIDPREIGGEVGGNLQYSTDESRLLSRAANCRPYIVRLEDAINRAMPERQFVKLNVDATIRTDIKTRVDTIGAQLADGRLSLNEARALEDRPPVDGGDFHNGPQPMLGSPTARKENTP